MLSTYAYGTNPREEETITYSYDALYRLTAADYESGLYFHYAHDAVGNRLEAVKRTSEQMPEVVTTYQYDEANRLAAVDGAAYEWDANGNLLSDGENRYTYDAGNHLIGVENAAGTAQYVYNGLGDRVSQTVNGITTNFVLDLNSGLTAYGPRTSGCS